MRTHAHAWTHIPIQTQVTLFEAEGSQEEFPLGIERGEGGKKETREERGLVKKEAGQVGWEEGNCSTCHDRMHCEGGAVRVGLTAGVLKMPWSERKCSDRAAPTALPLSHSTDTHPSPLSFILRSK